MIIVKVPAINGFGRTNGCEKAPDFIEKYFNKKFQGIKIDNSNIKETQETIFNQAKQFFSKKDRIIFIGGDHSISFPLTRAFFRKNKNSCLIVLDSHADFMPSMKEPSHEEWISALIREYNIPVFLVGAKQIFNQEKKEIAKGNIKIIKFNEFLKSNFIKEIIKFKNVYLSLDLDVFPKDIFDAVAYPQKRGLKLNQVSKIIKQIKPITTDIVEYNPNKDKNKKNLNVIREIIRCAASLQ
jgi:arginase family enzyme